MSEVQYMQSIMYLDDCFCFFFNDTATTEIYTLSLHDALPICLDCFARGYGGNALYQVAYDHGWLGGGGKLGGTQILEEPRSEEDTSELQSRQNLGCRLLLEKKKIYIILLISNCPHLLSHISVL